jgi:hypothetical protein
VDEFMQLMALGLVIWGMFLLVQKIFALLTKKTSEEPQERGNWNEREQFA